MDLPRLGTSRHFTKMPVSLVPRRLDKPAACPQVHRPDDDDDLFVYGPSRSIRTFSHSAAGIAP